MADYSFNNDAWHVPPPSKALRMHSPMKVRNLHPDGVGPNIDTEIGTSEPAYGIAKFL